MARSFKLPDLGEGIHEGEVLAVLVLVGDEVKEGDPIFEVETDKAAVEIPSPYTGTVKEILVKQGDIVKVGDALMIFSDGVEEEEAKAEEPVGEPPERAEKVVSMPAAGRAEGPVPASPATRRLGRELGVDLRHVTPSGPGGLVTADDVRAFAEKGEKVEEVPKVPEERPAEVLPAGVSVPSLPDFAKWGPIERVAVRSIRRATAKQMALAWSQIPHVHNEDWVDMTKLEAFRSCHESSCYGTQDLSKI
jgi:pyruvate dehydrogenase E2 component (dihydrolipoamide acetyltransferase)